MAKEPLSKKLVKQKPKPNRLMTNKGFRVSNEQLSEHFELRKEYLEAKEEFRKIKESIFPLNQQIQELRDSGKAVKKELLDKQREFSGIYSNCKDRYESSLWKLEKILREVAEKEDITSFRILFLYLNDPYFKSSFVSVLNKLLKMARYEIFAKYRRVLIKKAFDNLESKEIGNNYLVEGLKEIVVDSDSAYYMCELLNSSKNLNQQNNFINALGFAKDPIVIRFLVKFTTSSVTDIKGQAIIALTRLNPTLGLAKGLSFLADELYFQRKYLRTEYSILRIRIIEALKIFIKNEEINLDVKQKGLLLTIEILDSYDLNIKTHKRLFEYILDLLRYEPFKTIIDTLSLEDQARVEQLKDKIIKKYYSYAN